MKKLFYISSAVFTLALIFWGINNFVFKKNDGSQIAAPIADTGGFFGKNNDDVQSAPSGKISSLVGDRSTSFSLSRVGNSVIYYTNPSGRMFETFLDGSSKAEFSSKDIEGIERVSWSPTAEKAILQTRQGGKLIFYVHDFGTDDLLALREGVDSISWDNRGEKIIYKYFDAKTNKRSVNIADSNASNWKELAVVSYRNVSLASIPQSSLISFWNSPNANEETSLEIVGFSGEGRKTIFSGKFGADYLWSPDGSKALVSFIKEKGTNKMGLGVVKRDDGSFQELGIPTLVSKCAWSKNNTTVFCALPGMIPEEKVMPDDYFSKSFFTRDTFWKIDVASGKKDRIILPEEINVETDAADLILNLNEDVLIFLNRKDGNIYQLKF